VTPLRVVLDTNLLVSYLLTQGKTMTRIIDYWEKGDIIAVVSPAIIEELAEVVQRARLKQHMTVDPQVIINLILSDAIQTRGDLGFPGASRDPKDDKFLTCAVEGAAIYIVTGDEDLLSLKEFQGVWIVRPFDFVNIIEGLKNTQEL
jgi:putative PIN family toxin of toxin-antitoxin system